MHDVVIIGGGIAGLATAYRLQQTAAAQRRPLRLHLFEGSRRFGGKILSERLDGFLVEAGPDSFIPQKPWALELVRELGLEDRLLPSNDARRTTFVLHGGRLVELPEGLQFLVPRRWGQFLRSPLLSWPGKLRFAAERLVPPRREAGDESLADFVRRRLGDEALWQLAEPLLAHIHVADVERMSLRATYPRLAELETRHGSLRHGVAEVRSRGAGRPLGPVFWSLKGGISELVEALVEQLDPASLHLQRRVAHVRTGDDGEDLVVRLEDGRERLAAAVVLATPAWAAADLIAELTPGLATQLAGIRYVSMATLSLGYRRRDLKSPLDGFGFFVPRREQRRILACTWTSTKFDHRCDEHAALVRIFLGGADHEELLELPDDALIRTVRDELEEIMGLTAEPVMTRLHRWPRGYPQYDVGHLDRLRDMEATLPPGIFLAGSAYHGVGLPDCVRSGSEAARGVLEHLP